MHCNYRFIDVLFCTADASRSPICSGVRLRVALAPLGAVCER